MAEPRTKEDNINHAQNLVDLRAGGQKLTQKQIDFIADIEKTFEITINVSPNVEDKIEGGEITPEAGPSIMSPFGNAVESLVDLLETSSQLEAPGEFIREGFGAGGSLAGEQLGKVGGIPGRFGGTILGGLIGREGANLIQQSGAVPRLGQPSPNIMGELGRGVVADTVGQGAGELLGKFFSTPKLTSVKEGSTEAEETLLKQRKKETPRGKELVPGGLTLNQIDAHGPTEILANISRGGFFSNNILGDRIIANNRLMKNRLEDLSSTLLNKLSPQEAGVLFQGTLAGKLSTMGGVTLEKARNMDTLLSPVVQFASKSGIKNSTLTVPLKDRLILNSRLLAPNGRKLIPNIDKITHEQLAQVVTQLDSLAPKQLQIHATEIKNIKKVIKGAQTKQLNALNKMLKDNPGLGDVTSRETGGRSIQDLVNEAKGLSNDITKLSKQEVKTLANSTFIRELASKKPDVIMDKIFTEYYNKPQTIKKARELILKSEGGLGLWKRVEGTFAHRLLNMTKKGGEAFDFDAGAMVKEMQRLEDSGAMKEIFSSRGGQARLKNLKKIVNAIEVNNRAPSTDLGKFFIELRQGSAVFNVLAGGIGAATRTGLAILAGPNAIGRLLTNEKFAKFLTEGLTTQGQAKVRFLSRLSSQLTAMGFDVVSEEALNFPTFQGGGNL